ncbi:MAG: hypothetical protein HYS86_02415 [Candidatus Chisholmbacteria bacterium]|nr:hypothetical protein [Candidatus Chisholmbacteria bacterium]
MAQEETRAALAEIDRLENLGVNWTVVVAQMIETTRQQLMVVLGVEPQEKRVTALGSLDERTLWLLVDALLLAARRIRSSDIAQLPLEMMVVRWGEGKKHEARDTNYEGTRGTRSMESTEGMESIGGEGRTGSASRTSREDIEEISMPPPRSRSVAVSRGFEIAEVEKRWHEVLSAVRPHNHSVEGLLRSTRPAAVKGETLVIEVFYQFHLDQLKQERFMQIVEGALQEVFSHRWRLQYRLGERAHRPIRQVFDREAQTESAQDVPPIRQAQDVPPTRENTLENISAEVTDEDVVKVAEEVFGAE